MELRQLLYVEAVARHRHFTRAAADVGIAQSALSHQIKRLEHELGVELFRRSRAGVQLTEAGEVFLPHVRQALLAVRAGREELSALTGLRVGRVRLGAMQALGPLDLAGAIASFHATYPGIEVTLSEESTAEMYRLLVEDQLDLALVAMDINPSDGIEVQALVSEPVLLALPQSHPLRDCADVRIGQLREEPFVMFRAGTGLRATTERAAAEAGFRPIIAFETGNLDRILALVGEGLGIALVPASSAEHIRTNVTCRPLIPQLTRTVGLAWRAERPIAPAARAVREALVTTSRRSDGLRTPDDQFVPLPCPTGDESALVGKYNNLHAVPEFELVQDSPDVRFHGRFGHEQAL
jgi:DNA-binding transcriptional LysR family regulator